MHSLNLCLEMLSGLQPAVDILPKLMFVHKRELKGGNKEQHLQIIASLPVNF